MSGMWLKWVGDQTMEVDTDHKNSSRKKIKQRKEKSKDILKTQNFRFFLKDRKKIKQKNCFDNEQNEVFFVKKIKKTQK